MGCRTGVNPSQMETATLEMNETAEGTSARSARMANAGCPAELKNREAELTFLEEASMEMKRRLIADLGLAVLTVNGRVSPAERHSLEALDRLGFGSVSDLCEAELRRVPSRSQAWRRACSELAFLDSESRTAIVVALAEIAASDDEICTGEMEMVDRIAALLGLPPRHAVSLLNSAITSRAEQCSSVRASTRRGPRTGTSRRPRSRARQPR